MRITGSGTIEANVNPSANGALRGNDKGSENDLCKVAVSGFLAAVVAEYTHFQILNAVGSGVQLLVDWLTFRANLPATVHVMSHGVALANDGGLIQPMNPGGAVGTQHWYWSNESSQLGTTLWEYRTTNAVNASIPEYRFPILLEPGEGLLLTPDIVNNWMDAVFGVREI